MFFNKPKWLLYFFLVFIGSGMVANYNGFCFSQGRFLGEDEIYDNAIQKIINEYSPDVTGGWETIDGKTQVILSVNRYNKKYESVDQFKKENPSCCRIVPFEEWESMYGVPWYRRVNGGFCHVVEISFVHGEYDLAGEKILMEMRAHRLPITNCGYPRNDD
jgi:hypothetical protein